MPPAAAAAGGVRRRRRDPHAVFLALPYAADEALQNLAARHDFDVYGAGGFIDAVAVRNGTVAERYLSLNQPDDHGGDRQ